MKNQLLFKNFKIGEVKEDESGLIIEGWGAKYNNIDSYGDIMKPGSCTKTIQERGERIAFCYQHDIWNPIGKIQMIEDREEGLWLQVKLSAAEKDIQTKVKEKILQEMSIGYRVINASPATVDGKDVQYLNEVMLYEISLVTVAANPLAVITGMKADQKIDMIEDEMERMIAIERNPQKKFDLLKLKSIIIAALDNQEPPKITPKADEPQPRIELIVEDDLFTKNLKLDL